MDKTEFYWAVVGDSSPEPVAVVTKDGKRLAYTISCPDPFIVDGPDANIMLVPHPGQPDNYENWKWVSPAALPLEIPMRPADKQKQREENEARLERERKAGIRHGYAGFGARAAQLPDYTSEVER